MPSPDPPDGLARSQDDSPEERSLRDLPSVDRLLRSLPDDLPHLLRAEIARAAADGARQLLADDQPADPYAMASQAAEELGRARPQQVINATGVLLHTNLGRAPLHPRAAEAAAAAGIGYSNLEIDLTDGRRGRRGVYLRRLLAGLCDAQAALVVNNNAGALFLALAAIGRGGEVVVSRGELIEIGGSYRLPDLMAASGVKLVEVGTTNRTRLEDYERAITSVTTLLLKVHPSNYRIAGFAEEASLPELVELGGRAGVPVVYDLGSGLLDEATPWLPGDPPSWLRGEPGARQSLDAGADLVLFSGDKLLGGPQAGIILGRQDLVEMLARHPIARALRLDGPTLAALTVTAEMYASGQADQLPFWTMANASYEELEQRARRVIDLAGIVATVEKGSSVPGAGSVPGAEVPTPVIAVAGEADRIYLRLLTQPAVPVVARREAGRLLVDLRGVPSERDEQLAEAIRSACLS